MDILDSWWGAFFFGSLTVLEVFLASLVLATFFGLIGSTAKLSDKRFLRFLGKLYTVVFRGTPELIVVLLVYFGSAVVLTRIAHAFDPDVKFVDVPPFWAGACSIGLVVGSYMTETFRGAFLSVPQGQLEAATALGLTRSQTLIFVRLPQMWRLALPNFGNHMLSIMKDTALISVIGLEEIVFVGQMATTVTQKPFLMYMVVALIYLLITSALTCLMNALEYYANRHMAGAR